MSKQDKQVFSYPEERTKGLRAVGDKFRAKVKEQLNTQEQELVELCIKTFKILAPGPRVTKLLGQFLLDMSEEQYRQDKKYGTDSDDPNMFVVTIKTHDAFITKKKGTNEHSGQN